MTDTTQHLDHLRSVANLMGVTPGRLAELAQMLADGHEHTATTVAEVFPLVEHDESYKRGWSKRKGLHERFVERFGDIPAEQLTGGDIARYAAEHRDRIVADDADRRRRRVERGLEPGPRRFGTGAQRNIIEAARAYMRVAVDHKLVSRNVAMDVNLPPRGDLGPRAVSDDVLTAVFRWAATHRQADLVTLVFRTVLETGARRQGIIRLAGQDVSASHVVLFEKGGKTRRQPISPQLSARLHARVDGDGPVFITEDGTAVTRKWFEGVVETLRTDLPDAADVWVRLHDLRHTAVTNIERTAGSTAVARRFAGHAETSVTDRYVSATDAEVADAVNRWAERLDRFEAATDRTGLLDDIAEELLA